MYREDEYTQTYVLNVTSQTWLSDDVMDRSIWWHYAVLIVPKETRVPDAALALIVRDCLKVNSRKIRLNR